MSTRAIYTFIEEDGTAYHVYKHHDGYPSGAAIAIRKALEYAWPLPQFEADEFGAAFVAANKDGAKPDLPRQYCGGGVRLLQSGDWKTVAPGDIEYRYEIGLHAYGTGRHLRVMAFAVRETGGAWMQKELFRGPLDKFESWVEKEAAKTRA